MLEFSPPALLHLNDFTYSLIGFAVDFPDSLDTVAEFVTQLQNAIAEAIHHPLLSILVLLVGLGLLQLIADLIKRILKASISFILTLPLNLSQWIWKRATTSSTATKDIQIEQLIDRLDTLRAEEAQIITELKALLSADKLPADKPNSSNLLKPFTKAASSKTAEKTDQKTDPKTDDTIKTSEPATES